MRIPKQFQLGAITWEVVQKDNLLGAYGATYSGKGVVEILSDLPKQIKEQTFCHELVHCILFAMGKPSTEHDEVFVDGFAVFLHQYFNSAK